MWAPGHGYFSAEKFLVLAPVALARSLRLTFLGHLSRLTSVIPTILVP